jgi:hypothetical protein
MWVAPRARLPHRARGSACRALGHVFAKVMLIGYHHVTAQPEKAMTVQGDGLAAARQQGFFSHQEMSTMKQVAEITLVENSTAGNKPKIFAEQTVQIHHEADTVVTSVDGITSRGRHPSKVFWLGGGAIMLKNITDVKIVGANGATLIDGSLNTHYAMPRDVAGGVEFFVL